MYIGQWNSYSEFGGHFCVILPQTLGYSAKFDKICIKYISPHFQAIATNGQRNKGSHDHSIHMGYICNYGL